MRLNKYLSDIGVCSRRQADKMIEEGRVTVDGRKAKLGQQVEGDEEICVDHNKVRVNQKKVILLVNKPVGIVCTTEKREKNNIVDFLKYPIRIYPIGRLDKDSNGLILMTNDGEIVNKIMRAGNYHEKEYLVKVNRPITKEFLDGMANGVPILDTVTRKCSIWQVSKQTFRIVLTQGLNRQIRRMCEFFDYEVVSLKRERIMNLKLGDLKEGTYREITQEEKEELYRRIENSSSDTVKWNEEG
ncbi:23S rRNA pseudouridine(2604) synthase RluF [Eubacterium oxidoreducens]|uniref:Pseudouridine synthase n=1 Tax=Eubacterium oxidoreducens TaxID=1732 RepID=A0A1G6AJP3_EUBOX|nr:23S rRNA pseudouridine(2604) synthase RluF [Eubacterium oxidoreducens]SDB08618.1 23S rRNA pseudouridine2604 synthase [Eubacterium oxidoreducens]